MVSKKNVPQWHFIRVNNAAMAAIITAKANYIEKGLRIKTNEMASELILKGAKEF